MSEAQVAQLLNFGDATGLVLLGLPASAADPFALLGLYDFGSVTPTPTPDVTIPPASGPTWHQPDRRTLRAEGRRRADWPDVVERAVRVRAPAPPLSMAVAAAPPHVDVEAELLEQIMLLAAMGVLD